MLSGITSYFFKDDNSSPDIKLTSNKTGATGDNNPIANIVNPEDEILRLSKSHGLTKEAIDGLLPDAKTGLFKLEDDYFKKHGSYFPVNEGFRTFEQQQILKRKYPGLAAQPGESQHEKRRALDIDTKYLNDLGTDELASAGFYQRYGKYGPEAHHIELLQNNKNNLPRENIPPSYASNNDNEPMDLSTSTQDSFSKKIVEGLRSIFGPVTSSNPGIQVATRR